MLIALDGEWGLYMRLKDAPRYPRSKGLGIKGGYGAHQSLWCGSSSSMSADGDPHQLRSRGRCEYQSKEPRHRYAQLWR